MKILLLTFYYPPDLGAGSFRADAMVKALREVAGDSLELDVITTLPNRYSSRGDAAPERESADGLTIRRIAMPSHKSGMVDQSKSFAVLARHILGETRGGSWDAVVATSSRLMTGVLGARVARQAGAPFYLDLRDLFAVNMTDILAGKPTRAIVPGLRSLERYVLNTASRVNLVSEGFRDYVQSVAPQHDYRVFTNGIDDDFLESDFKRQDRNEVPLIVYAGNMGEGQGLHSVIPEAATKLQGRARIRLLGDGGQRRLLEEALDSRKPDNVELLDPVSRSELHEHYREADVLFLHLNDHPAFFKVLPSKIFEYAATGKPVLAGVAGHAAQFLHENVAGAEVFAPCDSAGMVEGFLRLDSGPAHVDRADFCGRYARSEIMHQMAADVLDLAGAGR